MAGSRQRLLGIVLYVAFLALFVEGSLQLFYRITTGSWLAGRAAHPIFAPNPVMGFQNRPNLSYELTTPEFHTRVYTNAEGFRTSESHEEFSRAKENGTLRVMVLGPSFAFGWGVDYEETCAHRIQSLLRQANLPGWRDVEVIDAGVNSMLPVPQVRWYQVVGSRYAPDLVIQFVYGSMAVDTSPEVAARVTRDSYLVPISATPFQRLIGALKKSATIFYGWVVWSRAEGVLGRSDERRVVGAGRELQLQSAFDPASPEVQSSLAFYEDLRAAVDESGARLLVVYFPLSYAVHRGDMGRWAFQGVHDVDSQIAFDAQFCDYLRARKLDCLNVSPDLRAAAASGDGRLYYWLDVHWTPRGNEVVAQAIAHHLITRIEQAEIGVPSKSSASQR